VATSSGGLIVSFVTDTNKEDMLSEIKVGMRFYTTDTKLQEAQLYLAEYDDKGIV
jgi:hypothetical protein